MAADEQLAERVRDLLAPMAPFEEKRMFGGLAFLVDGHITVAVSGRGGLMCHVDPDEAHLLVQEAGVERMEMNGRMMDAWLRVEAGAVEDDASLGAWVDRGVVAAKSKG
jgi:TfoX/Sxy family transcriptional regulator of competence genes